MQDFGFKDGIPGTPFHASVQSRNRIEAILVSKIRPAIDSPGTLQGDRSVVLRLYQSLMEELEASSTTMTNECAHVPCEMLAHVVRTTRHRRASIALMIGTDSVNCAAARTEVLNTMMPQSPCTLRPSVKPAVRIHHTCASRACLSRRATLHSTVLFDSGVEDPSRHQLYVCHAMTGDPKRWARQGARCVLSRALPAGK